MSALAPEFPLATGAVEPLRLASEREGRGDFSMLWAGEAAPMAREVDAGALTTQLWEAALTCASVLPLQMERSIAAA
jgi:nitronate monooxygenase